MSNSELSGGSPPKVVVGPRIGLTPLSEVDKLFGDFPFILGIRPIEQSHTRDISPIHTQRDHPGQTFDPDYHVRSYFSPEQQPLITATTRLLKSLVQGQVYYHDSTKTECFADKLVRRFLENNPNHIRDGHFLGAFVQANLDLLTDFSRFYPNLTPALRALHLAGGSSGIATLMVPTRVILEYAIDEYREKSVTVFGLRQVYEFVQMHPINERNPLMNNMMYAHRTHEMWCPAPQLAIKMYEQAQRAALILAQKPEVRESYDSKLDDDLPIKYLVEEILAKHLNKLYREVKA